MRAVLLVFRNELHRVLTLRPAFAVLVIAAALYALLYPQPYLSESLRKSPIVVVDQDHSTTSRDLIRRLDATPDVAVLSVDPDLPAAQRRVFARDASGILVIPEGFERELLRGNSSPVALYADASYFLIYQRVALGVVMAAAGYPGAPRTGDVVRGLPAGSDELQVFHAGSALRDGQIVTGGGRVLCVTALGDSVRIAQARALAAVRAIRFDGAQWRNDIGQRALGRH